MDREIPVTGAAVVALAANGIISIAFSSWLLTRWASAHEGQVYRAPGNFTNSSPGIKREGGRGQFRLLWFKPVNQVRRLG